MNVLLSIKPKYVEEIKKGRKKYEFRKSLCSKKNYDKLEKIFIYSTSPIQKIVGRFRFDSIIENNPEKLWEKCKERAGIEKEEFFEYFENKEKGLAIKISDLKFFKNPIDPSSLFPEFNAPQSFCYIEDIEVNQNITNFL